MQHVSFNNVLRPGQKFGKFPALHRINNSHLAIGKILRGVQEYESVQKDTFQDKPEDKEIEHKAEWNDPERQLPEFFLEPVLENQKDCHCLDQEDHDDSQ